MNCTQSKQILGGYVFDEFLGPWVLLIKSLGLALAVASGLSLGKEARYLFVACGRSSESPQRALSSMFPVVWPF